ncbi:MAG: DUF444 family protein [Candidatus Liptonbacteria bacterium]|nr:DUF444 family protein [Candidatus Liptonbacteria bacterium]
MSIVHSEPTAEKGKKDAKRHRDKQRDAIKKKLPEILSDESIITKRNGKTIKIPIKGIEIPRFRPAQDGMPTGIGQGPGKKGDVLRHRPGGAGAPGQAGQEPGEDFLETEMDIEELIEMMLEDLGLPKLEEKEVKSVAIELGWKLAGIQKTGPYVLLDRRKTAEEGMRRFWGALNVIMEEVGTDELTAFRALKQSEGIVSDAVEIIKNGKLTFVATEVEPFIIVENEDLRYHSIEKNVEYQSSAVVIAMMDVSGSMDDMKKYLARSILFWLVEFLRHLYQKVEVRFIIHHTEAKIVDEDAFFRTGESGGTECYAAYEMARNLAATEYPKEKWNIYVWHFSDGDDFDPERTAAEVKKLLPEINMLGYGEIRPGGRFGGVPNESSLWQAFQSEFSLPSEIENGLVMLTHERLPFLGVEIESREHILPALKAFLRKDRWVK